jgi:hypothetical protein
MSAKYFCDVCSDEMTNEDHGRFRRKLGALTVEVSH